MLKNYSNDINTVEKLISEVLLVETKDNFILLAYDSIIKENEFLGIGFVRKENMINIIYKIKYLTFTLIKTNKFCLFLCLN